MSVNVGRAQVMAETDKALLVQLDKEDKPRWVPKSQIHDDSEVYKGDSEPGDLVVTDWFAEQEDLG